jgi:hypothetical protein
MTWTSMGRGPELEVGGAVLAWDTHTEAKNPAGLVLGTWQAPGMGVAPATGLQQTSAHSLHVFPRKTHQCQLVALGKIHPSF